MFYRAYLARRWGLRSTYAAGPLCASFFKDYQNRRHSILKTAWIHNQGWSVRDWDALGITPRTKERYLSTAQYGAMHPLNKEYASWIDDKLTLKMLCAGEGLDDLMPDYYFQLMGRGRVVALRDCPERYTEKGLPGVLALLRDHGSLALKRIKGSSGAGFIRIEYKDGSYYVNGKLSSENALRAQLVDLDRYVVCELLRPHRDFARFSSETPNTIRYLACRHAGKLRPIRSYIRFGTASSGMVENFHAGGVMCYLSENGAYSSGFILDEATGRGVEVFEHPDTGERLAGVLPCWDDLIQAARRFSDRYPQLTYLGFDFVVTDDERVKLLEINSLSSLDALQLAGSALEVPCAAFFRTRLRNPAR